jgi:hypothetical protein
VFAVDRPGNRWAAEALTGGSGLFHRRGLHNSRFGLRSSFWKRGSRLARMKLLAGVVTAVVVVLALAGCGGGGSASSTESKAERNRIALEELDYAEEHNNNYSACVYARNVRRGDGERGISRADRYMLGGANQVCRTWRKEQREKGQP